MGALALVLGILCVVIAAIFPYFGWIAVLLGVLGIVFGAIAKKKGSGAGTAGMVLSIIGTAISLGLWLACAACAAGAGAL